MLITILIALLSLVPLLIISLRRKCKYMMLQNLITCVVLHGIIFYLIIAMLVEKFGGILLFGFGIVAFVIAAVISGFVSPAVYIIIQLVVTKPERWVVNSLTILFIYLFVGSIYYFGKTQGKKDMCR